MVRARRKVEYHWLPDRAKVRLFRVRRHAALAAAVVLTIAWAAVTSCASSTARPEFSVVADVAAGRALPPLIRRTEYGVPHILASDFRGIGMGLGYTQVEDYGERVILSLMRSKGIMGITFGRDSIAPDFAARLKHQRVQETYHLLDAATRGIYEGFAEGVNIFIRSHQERVPEWAQPVFTAHDVAALDVSITGTAAATRMVQRYLRTEEPAARIEYQPAPSVADTDAPAADSRAVDHVPAARNKGAVAWQDEDGDPAPDDVGSNTWAFAPSRTRSGNAILMRNPHLSWTAGYWEAHVTIPGVLNFYGDFRIGGPFAVIGGFNESLGFSTTNNVSDPDEVYQLDIDPTRPDHYLFDNAFVPIRRVELTVPFRSVDSTSGAVTTGEETRAIEVTPLGPVALRTETHVYVLRSGDDNEYRGGQQFLRMMLAQSLAEWKEAMRMRARATSNFTYADKDGNIFNVWNAVVPLLPHASGGDSIPIPARTSDDIWTELIPWDSLPQTENPPGGYLHNENDAPYYANLNAILDTTRYPPYLERPSLRLRSQLSLQLISGSQRFTLEEVIRLKHSPRMLLADRVKADLIAAVRQPGVPPELQPVADLLERWDNSAAVDSRGGMLFDRWWARYSQLARDSVFAEEWTPAQLTSTPRGLGNPTAAVQALAVAAQEVAERFGSYDVTWGEVHRVRIGDVDVPVDGCSGTLGCFRVLTYRTDADGKFAAASGDGWVLAVEFARNGPRAYSVLAYGQSSDPASPHHSDQAAMFARGELKVVRWLERDIQAAMVAAYRPGQRQVGAGGR